MSVRFKQIAEAHVLFFRDGQTLLLRRYRTGWQDGQYSVVAGHVESGESIRQAACREAFEEAGVTIEPDDLELVHVIHRKSDSERLSFFFLARNWSGEPFNAEPEKCDELIWVNVDEMPMNMVAYIAQAFEEIEAASPYSEYGWD